MSRPVFTTRQGATEGGHEVYDRRSGRVLWTLASEREAEAGMELATRLVRLSDKNLREKARTSPKAREVLEFLRVKA